MNLNDLFAGRSFLLTVRSFLLVVGLCCLQKIGFVFFAHGCNLFCSFLLKVEDWFGLLSLRFPRLEIGFGTRFPHRKQKRRIERERERESERDASCLCTQ